MACLSGICPLQICGCCGSGAVTYGCLLMLEGRKLALLPHWWCVLLQQCAAYATGCTGPTARAETQLQEACGC